MSEALRPARAERTPGRNDEPVYFPWEEVQLDAYREHSSTHPERMPYIEKVVRTFFLQELRNLDLFASKEMQAAFPYTVIRVTDLAKTLYATYGPEKPGAQQSVPGAGVREAEALKSRKEFLFTSALETFHGNGFTFSEWTLREVMRALPAALQALKEGREPDDVEFYTLGFPTNELGHMSESFAEGMQERPFEQLGQLYAEFVKSELQKSQSLPTGVVLKGISMGGSFAAEAAEELLKEGEVTQERKSGAASPPHLSIVMYSPTGTDESVSYAQIGAGFIADAAVLLATNARARKLVYGEKEFSRQLKEYVANRTDGRRMATHMDPRQKELKGKVNGLFGSIVQTLLRGVPIDPTLKVNKVTGMWDPTLFSFSRLGEAKKQSEKTVKRAGEGGGRRGLRGMDWVRGHRKLHSLARHTLTRSKEKHREFGLRSSHNIQLAGTQTEAEMRRWDRVAEMLRSY